MFLLLALCAVAGYSLQNALMARFYRKMDVLSATSFRGFTLALSMAPVLYFVPAEQIVGIKQFPWQLAFAALMGVFANWTGCYSYRFLPLGITSACGQGGLIIGMAILGTFIFREQLAPREIAGILVILSAYGVLAYDKRQIALVGHRRALAGMGYAFISGVFGALGFFSMGSISRSLNPLVAGYFWELTIGLAGYLTAILLTLSGRKRQLKISLREFWQIMIFSASTVVGTSCYALAVIHGPIAMLQAMMSLSMIATASWAYLFYRERLKPRQKLAMAIVLVGIVITKL